jgi:uncharacterized protein
VIQQLDDWLGQQAARWVDAVQARPRSVVALLLVLTAALLAVSVPHLGLDSNEEHLFRDDASFARARREFRQRFPSLMDPVVVVIDGKTPDLADDAADRLRRRLEADVGRPGARFASVYAPGDGEFFDRYGLLYLEPGELADLADHLAGVQPYLGKLSRDPSLRGLFAMMAKAARAAAKDELGGVELEGAFERVSEALADYLAGRSHPVSWSELLLDRPGEAHELRRFVLVQPVLDFDRIRPAETTLLGLRDVIAELHLDERPGVRVRLTGIFPLSYEEADHVEQQATTAGFASFVLVAIVLVAGLRSARLVLSILLTLTVGLAWTAGFAGLVIGRLNLISVSFTILFIGLSVDFGIHLGVAYREILAAGGSRRDSLVEAARGVGGSLAVCCATTAVAFYAFVPSDFRGVGELGLIAGTGMFVALFLNVTLLPALLALGPPPARPAPYPPLPRPVAPLVDLPVRHPRLVMACALGFGVASLFALPRVHFDLNPLRVRDPSAESVQTFDDLLEDGMAFPWNIDALTSSPEEAQHLAARLAELPEVDFTVTLGDFVPDHQEEKLATVEDLAFLLLPTLDNPRSARRPSVEAQRAALEDLEASLAELAASGAHPELQPVVGRLRAQTRALAERLAGLSADDRRADLDALDRDLLGSLPRRLEVLRTSLQAGPLTPEGLPDQLRSRFVASDGTVRVEIFPSEDLNDNAALARYVRAVESVAPHAYGEGIVIYEIGRVVVRAFQEALLIAAVAIALLLLALWRNVRDALLVALPLAMAALFTAAGAVVLHVPFNFANVIVIPLLLGMGVDTGIHLVHRFRSFRSPGENLLHTSTARSVVLSALTTLGSFGTLGFSSHRGLASLGDLLTLGIALVLASNLLILPALATLLGGRERGRRSRA